MPCCCHLTAAFNVSLELQGGNCSDQLTLICRHSDVLSDPVWIHNGTFESGQLLGTAFPGALYTVQSNTEHRVTISGVSNVQALDGYTIQCVYSILGNLLKSNAVKYTFIPPGQSGSTMCLYGVHLQLVFALPPPPSSYIYLIVTVLNNKNCVSVYRLCPSCPLCVHVSMSCICVQPSMYRMHALYIVELALVSLETMTWVSV